MRRRILRQFGRDEEGGILIFALLLLVVMLVLGGMAVDFMRFESRRALLQSVSDRAVLAAAELDQTIAPRDVVLDYFDKAGFGSSIIGEPRIDDVAGSRSVEVDSAIDLNTYYLKFVGIDQLSAPAVSGAIEGTGNIEVSLVLDISGSMRSWVSGTGKRRYELLREAATGFVEALLKPEYEDQVSISMVNYSANVSIGDELYAALNTTSDTLVHPTNGSSHTNTSRCVDFEDTEFNTTEFNTTRVYEQIERFDYYTGGGQSGVLLPSCPDQWFEGIIPLTQDKDLLTDGRVAKLVEI